MKKMPIQPIEDYRFVPNRIVQHLLDNGPFDMNSIAMMDFTNEEREQFAQLIGYSISGFGSLGYVSDETYNAAEAIAEKGLSEEQAKIETLQETLDNIRKGLRLAVPHAFPIHPEDLET